ncbi:hypothetical protein OAO18_03355 [Francisellaceae bacterium]|nr:hypothetical protein [Francisellaceae bacterium]
MKIITIITGILAVFFSLFSTANADSDINIADGYYDLTGKLVNEFYARPQNCFTSLGQRVETGSSQGQSFVYDSKTLTDAVGFGLGVDVSYKSKLVTGTHGEIGYDTSTINNSTSSQFWEHMDVYQNIMMDNGIQLTSYGDQQVQNVVDAYDTGNQDKLNTAIDSYIRNCGTSYITSYKKGAHVDVNLILHSKSYASNNKFTAGLNADTTLGQISKKLEAESHNSSTTPGEISKKYQLKGTDLSLPQPIIDNINNCNINADGSLTDNCFNIAGSTGWAGFYNKLKSLANDNGVLMGLPEYESSANAFTNKKIKRLVQANIDSHKQTFLKLQTIWEQISQVRSAANVILDSVQNQKQNDETQNIERVLKSAISTLDYDEKLFRDNLYYYAGSCFMWAGECSSLTPDSLISQLHPLDKDGILGVSLALNALPTGKPETQTVQASNAQSTNYFDLYSSDSEGIESISDLNGQKILPSQLSNNQLYKLTLPFTFGPYKTDTYVLFVKTKGKNKFSEILKLLDADDYVYHPIILKAGQPMNFSGPGYHIVNYKIIASNIIDPTFLPPNDSSNTLSTFLYSDGSKVAALLGGLYLDIHKFSPTKEFYPGQFTLMEGQRVVSGNSQLYLSWNDLHINRYDNAGGEGKYLPGKANQYMSFDGDCHLRIYDQDNGLKWTSPNTSQPKTCKFVVSASNAIIYDENYNVVWKLI